MDGALAGQILRQEHRLFRDRCQIRNKAPRCSTHDSSLQAEEKAKSAGKVLSGSETAFRLDDLPGMDPLSELESFAGPRPVLVLAAEVHGVDARIVEIQASAFGSEQNPPRILGLPDAAVREAYHRVRTAFQSLQMPFPRGQVVVNLAPACTRKAGSGFDLSIALALACLAGFLAKSQLAGRIVIGELGLDGRLRAVPGVLAMVELARNYGIPALLCPLESVPLALLAARGEVGIHPTKSLADALEICRGHRKPEYQVPELPPLSLSGNKRPKSYTDLSRVRGQETARQALMLAAVGGHNILLSGPPGCGKSLLASCLPGLLPKLDMEMRLCVLRIRNVLETDLPDDGLQFLEEGIAPFRAPHHTISYAGLVGGGTPIRPGEISMAHGGVLFLDELPEFRRESLEALRQPLEQGQVHIRRSEQSIIFPARFQLITAMNPCPCGLLGHPSLPCRDSPQQIQRYRGRISGPLLDRIDLHLSLQPVSGEDFLSDRAPELPLSEKLRKRVVELRERQLARNGGVLNAFLGEVQLRAKDRLAESARKLLLAHCKGGRLSARGITRVLRVAQSLADLADSERIREEDLAGALHYRWRDGAERGP